MDIDLDQRFALTAGLGCIGDGKALNFDQLNDAGLGVWKFREQRLKAELGGNRGFLGCSCEVCVDRGFLDSR